MIEILVLFRLGARIAARASDKGRRGFPYVFLLLALWFGGGCIAGAILSLIIDNTSEPHLLLVYGGGLSCAIIGAVLAFKIVAALPPLDADEPEPPDWQRK